MVSRRLLPVEVVPMALFLFLLLGVPVIVLALYSVWRAEFFEVVPVFTLANYQRLLAEPLFLQLIGRSIGIGLIVAGVTIPVAFVLAYAINFAFARYARLLLVLVMVSMLSSYLVRIYAWKTILGPEGVINQLLMGLKVIAAPLGFLLYGDFALVITLTHILVPFAVLPIFASLQEVDHAYLDAARDLGSSPPRAFFTVVLPICMPGITSAFLFSFILAAADYITPQLVGGSSGMLVGRVIADQFGMAGNAPFGAVLSLTLIGSYALVILALVLLRRPLAQLYWRAAGRPKDRHAAAVPRKLFRSTALGRLPWLKVGALSVLLFLYLPLFILVLFSFNASPTGVFPIEALSLRWYADLVQSTGFLRALQASILVALIVVAGALCLGVPASFALSRTRFYLRPLVLALVVGPIAVPGIVIGISLLASIDLLGAHGGYPAASVAHILFTLPFVVLVLRARLAAFDWHLEDAARDLGSNRRRTFRTVTLPLIAPAMLGAGILVAALSLDEFIITNFVIGAKTTLPVYIWGQMRTGITPSVNAVASFILIASTVLLGIAAWAMGRRSEFSSLITGAQSESATAAKEASA